MSTPAPKTPILSVHAKSQAARRFPDVDIYKSLSEAKVFSGAKAKRWSDKNKKHVTGAETGAMVNKADNILFVVAGGVVKTCLFYDSKVYKQQ